MTDEKKQTRPLPKHPDDQSRWAYSGLVHRLLTGRWKEDAQRRLESFFHESVWPSLSPVETGRNAKLSIVRQKAILYDETPEVDVESVEEVDLSPIETPELWPLMQRALVFVIGMNECLMRVDWTEGVGISYRVVTPDYVVAKSDPARPDVPVCIEELRWRDRYGWTWDVWDVSDPKAPTFKVFRVADGEGLQDITHEAVPGFEGGYPYFDRSGAPILPYVLHHARVGNSLWDPYYGSESVHGTLTAAAYWTMFGTGMRDGSHPQRVIIDGIVEGGESDTRTGTRQIALTQTAVLPVTSRGDRQASLDQWAPTMDPLQYAEAIEAYETGLSVHDDISPADAHRGSKAMSGYSIVVSRDGQRKAARRLEPPMRMANTLLLATAARLHNRFAGGNLPEDPDAYSITYCRPSESPDEIRAKIAAARALLDDLLITPADAYRRFHPGVSDEKAIDAMRLAAEQKRMIAAAPEAPISGPEEVEDDDTTTTADPEEA